MSSWPCACRPFLPDALDDEAVLRVVPLIKERLVKLADARELVAFLDRGR